MEVVRSNNMSADTGVYILQTLKNKDNDKEFEFRVSFQSAIDNYKWDNKTKDYTNDTKIQIKNARKMWKDCKIFTDAEESYREAMKIHNDWDWTEYGIVVIQIDEKF
jgi:hypothetical protein